MAHLVVTGGGTAGHVMLNLVLIKELTTVMPELKISYFGSKTGMERDLVEADNLGINYEIIPSGKLRRYFSIQNIFDFFKFTYGIKVSFSRLNKLKPKLVFSTGGYISLPVAIAAKMLKIPIVIQECDSSLGLTSRITAKIANEIWYTNPRVGNELKKKSLKIHIQQKPLLIRKSLLTGNAELAKNELGFDNNKPIILIMGGSLGAEAINRLIDANLETLTSHYNLIHICGKGKKRENKSGYKTFEFVGEKLSNYLAAADLIISRAGATSLAEWHYLNKPVILFPLPTSKSRGEQILNAQDYIVNHNGLILNEEKVDDAEFINAISNLIEKSPCSLTANLKEWQQVVDSYITPLLRYL